MLFGYELKKIMKRVLPLLVIFILLAVATTTMVITACAFNHAPVDSFDPAQAYQELADQITGWDIERQDNLATSFNDFYDNYKKLNRSATYGDDDLVKNYNAAYQAFQTFYTKYYMPFIHPTGQDQIANYLLVRGNYISKLDTIITRLGKYFDTERSDDDSKQIIQNLYQINTAWKGADIQEIFQNILVQNITEDDLTNLQNFIKQYPANQPDYDYTNAYDSLHNQYYLALHQCLKQQENYSGNLADYNHYQDYQGVAITQRAIQTANYRLKYDAQDYAEPFAFGKIFNHTTNVSLFDFVFTNLEMAAIPLLLIVIIWGTCAFFTDTYQNTIITSLTASKRRTPVLLTKICVTLTLGILALLCFVGIYIAGGLIFFHAAIGPEILFLANGITPTLISPINYFVLYVLNLVWKMFPFIAICGLFSFSKTKPMVIVGTTLLIFIAIILCNALLGSFSFYQFIPLQALDPIRYSGAQLFISPTPPVYNFWYTFPILLMINVGLYWQLIYNFRHRDFK